MLNILNVAQTGLQVSQTQVENVMTNLANENTPGYTKRVVNVSELEQIDSRLTGRGVQIDDVSRITDIYMYQNLITEESELYNLDELNEMLSGIETLFYETDTSGMSADIDRYFNSIENLRTNPADEVYKNDVENNALVIVANLKELYQGIEQQENLALLNIKENVSEVNNLLNEIGEVSKQIIEDTGSLNDLLDKRDSLEKELAQYIDVEISREESYQLTIGGVTAVRFDTNVQELILIEEYTPQSDVYAKLDTDGTTLVPYEDSLLESSWNDPAIAEVQAIDLSGVYDDGSVSAIGDPKTILFLGATVPTTMGASSATMTTDIITDKVNIIDTWNANNPDKKISDITAGTGDQVLITYEELEGDVPPIDNDESNGIFYTGSVETVKGEVDSFTYNLNNEFSLTVTYGETIVDHDGNPIDLNNDGVINASDDVDETNALKAMIYKINESQDIGAIVTAYNGQYELDDEGNKILTNNPLHSEYDPLDPEKDRYLVIESNIDGEVGSFVGEFVVNDSNSKSHVETNDYLSEIGTDDIHLEIYEKEIDVSGGSLSAMIDNVQTESGNNIFNSYKEKLDEFAKTLSDLTDSYIENPDQSYVYGTSEVEISSDEDNKISLNMFTGADVKSLTFNKASLNNLTQSNLDYLASLQWKEDIDFDESGNNEQSFSQFYQSLRVSIADNKENTEFKLESQEAISVSIQTSYDQLTKVDSDTELIELIKYQSAYEANAKMITVVDEMLQTILNF